MRSHITKLPEVPHSCGLSDWNAKAGWPGSEMRLKPRDRNRARERFGVPSRKGKAMALSAAEWKRRQEEEDVEPAYFGLTWGEFRRLPERQQFEIRQRITQFGATHIGFWKDCNLARCRRTKRCVGFLTDAQYAQGYDVAFPPCIRKQEERRARVFNAVCALYQSSDSEPKYDGRRGADGEGDW